MKPQLLVDDHGRSLGTEPGLVPGVGIPGPFGRERVVSCLPLNKAQGSVLLEAARVLRDDKLCYLADPDGNLLGTPAVIVHRMLSAGRVHDTRRL